MNKVRWSVACLVLVGLSCVPEGTPPAGEFGQPATDPVMVTRPPEVTEALAALEMPTVPPGKRIDFGNGLLASLFETGPNRSKGYDPGYFRDDCPAAIHLLTTTASRVDPDLLRIARSDNPVHVRFRAALVLAQRKNQAVIPILEAMCTAADPVERYVAWWAYSWAVEEKSLPVPRDCRPLLALYERETDDEVQGLIERLFGTARVKDAVPLLLDKIARKPADDDAVRALGEIGDVRAVPGIIRAFQETKVREDAIPHLEALGKLDTPDAVALLIKHLDDAL